MHKIAPNRRMQETRSSSRWWLRWAHPRRKEICINRNVFCILRRKRKIIDRGWWMDGCGDRVSLSNDNKTACDYAKWLAFLRSTNDKVEIICAVPARVCLDWKPHMTSFESIRNRTSSHHSRKQTFKTKTEIFEVKSSFLWKSRRTNQLLLLSWNVSIFSWMGRYFYALNLNRKYSAALNGVGIAIKISFRSGENSSPWPDKE